MQVIVSMIVHCVISARVLRLFVLNLYISMLLMPKWSHKFVSNGTSVPF